MVMIVVDPSFCLNANPLSSAFGMENLRTNRSI
jgi:hypothetical protein